MFQIKCYTLNELLARASNIVGDNKNTYTIEMFLQDFPEFSKKEIETVDEQQVEVIKPLVPESMINQFIVMANDAIQEDRWFTKWRFATGLYIAHYSALYLRTYQPASDKNSVNKVVAGSRITGNVASASLGDQTISYDNSAITRGTEQWGAWNATSYGQLLVTEAALLGKGGAFII